MSTRDVTIAVLSARLAAAVPWRLDVFVAADERGGVLSTDRAESSRGLPVVVVDGVAYGPADLGPHELVVFGLPADRQAARAAGYTVREVQS